MTDPKRHPKDCPHLWEQMDQDENGDPNFVLNRQMWKGRKAYFRCARCNCQTWLSKKEWDDLEESSEYAY